MIDKYISIYMCSMGHIGIKCLNDGVLNFQNIYEGISKSGHPDFPFIHGWQVSERELWEMRLKRDWLFFLHDHGNSLRKCGYFERNLSFFKSIYIDRIETLLVNFIFKNSLTLSEFDKGQLTQKYLSYKRGFIRQTNEMIEVTKDIYPKSFIKKYRKYSILG